MDAETAGARLSAAFGPCRHEQAEPVDLLVTGERVAMICAGCLIRLPANWGGEVEAIYTFASAEPVAYVPVH